MTKRERQQNELQMIVVYKIKDEYIAKTHFWNIKTKEMRIASKTIITKHLSSMQGIMTDLGLIRAPRLNDDDAAIVETWL